MSPAVQPQPGERRGDHAQDSRVICILLLAAGRGREPNEANEGGEEGSANAALHEATIALAALDQRRPPPKCFCRFVRGRLSQHVQDDVPKEAKNCERDGSEHCHRVHERTLVSRAHPLIRGHGQPLISTTATFTLRGISGRSSAKMDRCSTRRGSLSPRSGSDISNDPFLRDFAARKIEGVDMVTVDADIAGCVQTWLNSSSALDKMRTGVLRGCLDDLDRVLPQLSDPEEADYYAGLRDLAARVLSAQRARP